MLLLVLLMAPGQVAEVVCRLLVECNDMGGARHDEVSIFQVFGAVVHACGRVPYIPLCGPKNQLCNMHDVTGI